MLSIQEMVQKTEQQRKAIEEVMDSKGYYHPEDANLFMGQKRSIQREISESLRKIPLREFLGKGIAGADYLIPAKIHQILISASKRFDIVPQISMQIVEGWQGGSLKVDIIVDESLRAKKFASGGEVSTGLGKTVQATLTPISFGQTLAITNDMIEDAQWDLIEWHIQQAAKSMGYQASDLALEVLKTATDGDGTLNSSATGDADETKWTGGTTADIETAIKELGADEFVPNTIVMTSEAWMHSVSSTITRGWSTKKGVEGYDLQIGPLDVIISNSSQLHNGSFANCITLVFDRFNALLTGRKRWLQIERYSDPIRDLAGAVVTARQDSVTIYNDSIYKLTES